LGKGGKIVGQQGFITGFHTYRVGGRDRRCDNFRFQQLGHITADLFLWYVGNEPIYVVRKAWGKEMERENLNKFIHYPSWVIGESNGRRTRRRK